MGGVGEKKLGAGSQIVHLRVSQVFLRAVRIVDVLLYRHAVLHHFSKKG